MDERRLLADFYLSQAIVLALAFILLAVQGRSPVRLLDVPETAEWTGWALATAAAAVAANAAFMKWAPEAVSDDGLADRLFGKLPLWHAAWVSVVAAACEELLFRGAVQYWAGPYGAAALFAVAHVRYLRHWLSATAVFAIGAALGWTYVRTGTLWCPIAAHGVINFATAWIIRCRRGRS